MEPAKILYIEPKEPASAEPILDDLTRGMAGCLRAGKPHGPVCKAVHVCSCGASSGCQDIELPACSITNSLAVHYLAYHRHEVNKAEVGRVLAETHWSCSRLGVVPADPTPEELQPPRKIPLPGGAPYTVFSDAEFYRPVGGPPGIRGDVEPDASAVRRTLRVRNRRPV